MIVNNTKFLPTVRGKGKGKKYQNQEEHRQENTFAQDQLSPISLISSDRLLTI